MQRIEYHPQPNYPADTGMQATEAAFADQPRGVSRYCSQTIIPRFFSIWGATLMSFQDICMNRSRFNDQSAIQIMLTVGSISSATLCRDLVTALAKLIRIIY